MRRRTSRQLPTRAMRPIAACGLAPGALPDSWSKEDLSIAYVQAVATAVGVSCDPGIRDINGWDVHFAAQDTEHADALQLHAQLKCTVNRLRRIEGGRAVSFSLPSDDYDQLCRTPTHPPRLLVVVEAAHEHRPMWVDTGHGRLLVRASAFYASLAGEQPIGDTAATKSVRIPAGQRFTPRALLQNMRSCP